MRTQPGKPIHVLQLLQGLNIGGIERMVESLVHGLDAARFRTSFCTFDWRGKLAGELEAAGYALYHRKRRGGLDLGWVAWLARLLQRHSVDVVHAHNATALFYGAMATSLVPGTRLLYTEHDRAFPSARRDRILHALLARRTHAVATVSATLREHLLRWESFPASRLHVIRNGVQMPMPQRSRAAMRRDLDLGDRPVAGIVARLAGVKNHALLLRSWKRVVADVPDAVLVVVGNGSQEENLRGLHQQLGLGESVRFLGFRQDISELLLAMDVFVLSSLSEGLSLTLLEAEACGLPVVATRVGGNPEVVLDGETGLLVPSEQELPLAAALARLLQDAPLRRQFGERGRSYYEQHFTLAAMLRGYVELYCRLAGVPVPTPEAPARPEAEAVGGGIRA
jgi:glycosyltransferase involved in cell wall biosynthesis